MRRTAHHPDGCLARARVRQATTSPSPSRRSSCSSTCSRTPRSGRSASCCRRASRAWATCTRSCAASARGCSPRRRSRASRGCRRGCARRSSSCSRASARTPRASSRSSSRWRCARARPRRSPAIECRAFAPPARTVRPSPGAPPVAPARGASLLTCRIPDPRAAQEAYIYTEEPAFLAELAAAVKKLLHRVDAPLLRSILSSYYDTITRSVTNAAPKAIMLHMVKATELSIYASLFENLYARAASLSSHDPPPTAGRRPARPHACCTPLTSADLCEPTVCAAAATRPTGCSTSRPRSTPSAAPTSSCSRSSAPPRGPSSPSRERAARPAAQAEAAFVGRGGRRGRRCGRRRRGGDCGRQRGEGGGQAAHAGGSAPLGATGAGRGVTGARGGRVEPSPEAAMPCACAGVREMKRDRARMCCAGGVCARRDSRRWRCSEP